MSKVKTGAALRNLSVGGDHTVKPVVMNGFGFE